jgi:hypothetical protein
LITFGCSVKSSVAARGALAPALQATAGLDAIQVAVDVDLQEVGRVVGGAPRRGRLGAIEAESGKIQLADECVDHSNRVVIADEVVQAFGHQGHLLPVLSLDESRHVDSKVRDGPNSIGVARRCSEGFHTASVESGSRQWRSV